MLGLKNGTNALVDYDPEWPAEFARERQRLAAALDGVALGIEHYGSTAVPGMRAKPILDILVGVSPLEGWQLCRDPLLQTPACPGTTSSDAGAMRRSGRTWCTSSSILVRPGAATWRFAIRFEWMPHFARRMSTKRSARWPRRRWGAADTTS